MSLLRKTIFYSGSVQGVGFRWTTARTMKGLDLSGYVRNLPDGRVELVVEGPAALLEEAETRVRRTLGGYIRATEVQTSPATGEFDEFGIRL